MTWNQFARIVEIRTKLISISAFLIGTLFALYARNAFSPIVFILMTISVLAVDMATTAFNSYFDFRRGVDSEKYNQEDDKVLISKKISPDTALFIALGLYGVAAFYGLALAVKVGWEVLAVGALGMTIGFFYNGGPYPISNTPVGELFAGGFLGSVLLVLSFYVHTAEVSINAFFVSIPSLLLVASILTVNNTCDIEGDREAGRKTFSILVGRKAASIVIYLTGIISFALLFLYAAVGILPLWTFFLAPPALIYSLLLYLRMQRRGYSHSSKGPSMQNILRIFGIYTLALISSLILGILSPIF